MLNISRRLLLYAGIGVLSLIFFGLDWLTPVGPAVELLQVAVVLLTLFLSGRTSTLAFGLIATLFVGIGGALQYDQAGFGTLVNRGLVLLGLWAAVAVVLRYKQVRRARRESEARAQAILESTVEGIITIDAEGTIESFNQAAEDIFGYNAGEVVGKNISRLLSPSDREAITEHLRIYRETGQTAIIGPGQETIGQRRDGTTFPMELSVSEVELDDRSILTTIVRDITERKRGERRMTIQYLTAQILTESDSLSEAAPRILQTICEKLEWEWGELWVPNAEGTHLENAEIWRAASVSLPQFEAATRQTTFGRGEGLPGSVWEEQRPKWLPDVRKHKNFVRVQAAVEADMKAGFAFPIQLGSVVFGVMVFFSRDIREPDEGLLQMFSVIGNQIGQFTERRRAEDALQRSAKQLRRAQEIANLGSWEYDPDTEEMLWSKQMYRIVGADPDTFTPTLEAFLDTFPSSEDRQRFEEALGDLGDGDASFSLEHQLLREDGSKRWVFSQAQLDADRTVLVGTTLDITELRETEKALRESEAKAQAILESTVEGIITIDAEGTIESFNQAAEDIFGYDAEEVIGENVKILMPPPYREEHDEYLRSYHETGRRRIIGIDREVRGQRKDGSTFPMELAVSEVELGDRIFFTGIVRDISERRQLEREILNVSEEERRRIGQDLHDGLGQMLTGIGLLSQDLARQLEEEGHERAEDAREITEHIEEADQYARDLSHGLIPVDVEANGLSEALRRLSQNAERLFDVQCSYREVGTVLIHDNTTATHLYRIAQEAVSNATRHGDADHVKIILASGDDQIRLQVRDDGKGFEEEATDGSGMGVHIMNYRARIIGGTLEVSSELGDGTVVTCTLPRTASTPEEERAVRTE